VLFIVFDQIVIKVACVSDWNDILFWGTKKRYSV